MGRAEAASAASKAEGPGTNRKAEHFQEAAKGRKLSQSVVVEVP